MRDYVCVDIETTGISPQHAQIIEIGALRVRDGEVVDTFSQLIDPGVSVPEEITSLTGITTDMVKGEPSIEIVLPEFIAFAGDDLLLGHNVRFDYSFLKQNAMNLNLEFSKSGMDTLRIARAKCPELKSRSLDFLCDHFCINDENHHRAFNDAKVTSELYLMFYEMFHSENPELFQPKEFVYKPKKSSPITEKQKKYLLALISHHNLVVGYDIDKLSKSEASRKIDQIISIKGKIIR
ncbi:MAG: 3'-5' exonuclease [Eubacterium sp.]|nr:3'-5' exonuclease [Eubacterium sp.]